jgi:hypothetical protein
MAFIIMENRTNPKHQAVAFELNMSFGNGSTMMIPILAKMPEPLPTMLYCSMSCMIIIMLVLIGPRKNEEINIKATILSMVEERGMSFTGFKNNSKISVTKSEKLEEKWRTFEDKYQSMDD